MGRQEYLQLAADFNQMPVDEMASIFEHLNVGPSRLWRPPPPPTSQSTTSVTAQYVPPVKGPLSVDVFAQQADALLSQLDALPVSNQIMPSCESVGTVKWSSKSVSPVITMNSKSSSPLTTTTTTSSAINSSTMTTTTTTTTTTMLSSSSVDKLPSPNLVLYKSPKWLPSRLGTPSEPINRLRKEVNIFVEWLGEKESEHKARQAIIRSLEKYIMAMTKDKAKLTVYGSYLTGLNLPTSDVDMAIESVTEEAVSLRTIRDVMNANPRFFSSVSLIPDETLLEFVYQGVPFDISTKRPKQGPAVVEEVKRTLSEDPMIKPLTLLFKWILYQYDKNVPYRGGLSSYSAFLMVRHYMQVRRKIYPSESNRDLTDCFLGFLQFYGEGVFNRANTLVSVREEGRSGWKEDSPHMDALQRDRLFLEDPLDSTNNVSKMSWQDFWIFNEMQTIYRCLMSTMEKYKEWHTSFKAERKSRNTLLLNSKPPIILTSVVSVPQSVYETRGRLQTYKPPKL